MKKTVHFFERQNLPLRFGVLFFRVIDLFFLILCQNEGLPRVILENHFETAPFLPMSLRGKIFGRGLANLKICAIMVDVIFA